MPRTWAIYVALFVTGAESIELMGQAPTPPMTATQNRMLEFFLQELADLDKTPEMVRMTEQGVAYQFGLNSEELASLRLRSMDLNAVLRRNRQQLQSAKGNGNALATLASERRQAVDRLTAAFLASVRPETASRIRAAGDAVDKLASSRIAMVK